MLRRLDLFKRRVLFKLSGKYVAKEPKKHLEVHVQKNELDKMAIKLNHENRHRCDQAKNYSGELLIDVFSL